MTEQELFDAIKLSDRRWKENELAYIRRRKELVDEHHDLTVELITLLQEKGETVEQIKKILKESIYA